jgi:hypothetical protein
MTYINQSLKNLLNPNSHNQFVASDILLNICRYPQERVAAQSGAALSYTKTQNGYAILSFENPYWVWF